MKTCLAIIALMFVMPLLAQERRLLNGKIVSGYEELEGIYVLNNTSETTVKTSNGGYFTIQAKAGDVILFSSPLFVSKEITIQPEDLQKDLLLVKLEFLSRDLDEVTINRYNNLDEESLGLVPKGQKQYTPAERKLATASDSKMNPMGLDPLMNRISGRTEMLKNAYATEKKEQLMEKINYVYEEEEIIDKFNIPKEYFRGFIYYIVDDKEFASAIKANNDTRARFLMSRLSVEFLKLIADAE